MVMSWGDDVISSRQASCRIPVFRSSIRHYIGSNIWRHQSSSIHQNLQRNHWESCITETALKQTKMEIRKAEKLRSMQFKGMNRNMFPFFHFFVKGKLRKSLLKDSLMSLNLFKSAYISMDTHRSLCARTLNYVHFYGHKPLSLRPYSQLRTSKSISIDQFSQNSIRNLCHWKPYNFGTRLPTVSTDKAARAKTWQEAPTLAASNAIPDIYLFIIYLFNILLTMHHISVH
jgi:hypothetical protein